MFTSELRNSVSVERGTSNAVRNIVRVHIKASSHKIVNRQAPNFYVNTDPDCRRLSENVRRRIGKVELGLTLTMKCFVTDFKV